MTTIAHKKQGVHPIDLLALATQLAWVQNLIWWPANHPEAAPFAVEYGQWYWIRLADGQTVLATPNSSLVAQASGDPGPFPYLAPGWWSVQSHHNGDQDKLPNDTITHFAPCYVPDFVPNTHDEKATPDDLAEAVARIEAADRLVYMLGKAMRHELDRLAGQEIDYERGLYDHTGTILAGAGYDGRAKVRVENTKTGTTYNIDWGQVLIDGQTAWQRR